MRRCPEGNTARGSIPRAQWASKLAAPSVVPSPTTKMRTPRSAAQRSRMPSRRAVSSAVVVAIAAQHKAHPTWSYKLHADNLVALVTLGELVGHVPSYTTV